MLPAMAYASGELRDISRGKQFWGPAANAMLEDVFWLLLRGQDAQGP